ncbi:MAG: polyprenyl synthetase family protein, partial [Clostridia bacterium]|nr:polyprenyl synthetase family protein [Clostridia bacterium]
MKELNELILESYADLVDSRLEVLLEGQDPAVKDLTDAMRYSTMIGGKRVRPVLVLEFCRICGEDPARALDLACALEMIHPSSLIHDAMPCMDDDDLRRGKPSCHKEFGENIALLAGDALEACAFDVAASSDLPAKALVEAVQLLAKATGPYGMLGGQVMDVENESRTDVDLRRLTETHRKKTGALIRVACELGCIAAGASAEQRKAANEYGAALGV